MIASHTRRLARLVVGILMLAGARTVHAENAPRTEQTNPGLPRLSIARTFPEVGGGQQGIATDGKHVYVQSTTVLLKYDLSGKLIAKSSRRRLHHGGILYRDGKIYAAVSKCAKAGTRMHLVCVYDAKTLAKLAEHDVGKWFTVCAGGIAYHDGHYYVAESFYDNDHDDYIVQFDAEFKHVKSHRIAFKCPFGIQGLDYLPSIRKFMVNSHGKAFYLIDTNFDNRTIEPGRAPFALQDVAYLNPTTVLINHRAGKKVAFARIDDGTTPRSTTKQVRDRTRASHGRAARARHLASQRRTP